jgi:carboxypeptidase Taq
MVAGRLAVADLLEARDADARHSGPSTIDTPQDGPMQDVHWPAGLFGYFPSYTLGAMMAAQQWAALRKLNPSIDDDIAKGKFDAVNDWRRHNIWSRASRYSTPELLERATGEKLNVAHLKRTSRRDTERHEGWQRRIATWSAATTPINMFANIISLTA